MGLRRQHLRGGSRRMLRNNRFAHLRWPQAIFDTNLGPLRYLMISPQRRMLRLKFEDSIQRAIRGASQ